jgi:hypothetical protein
MKKRMGGLQVNVRYFCYILIETVKCQQLLIELSGVKSHAHSLTDSVVFHASRHIYRQTELFK